MAATARVAAMAVAVMACVGAPMGVAGCGGSEASPTAGSASASDALVGVWRLDGVGPESPSIEVRLGGDGRGEYRARGGGRSQSRVFDVSWQERGGGTVTVHKMVDGQSSSVAMLTLRRRSPSELTWVGGEGAAGGGVFIRR